VEGLLEIGRDTECLAQERVRILVRLVVRLHDGVGHDALAERGELLLHVGAEEEGFGERPPSSRLLYFFISGMGPTTGRIIRIRSDPGNSSVASKLSFPLPSPVRICKLSSPSLLFDTCQVPRC
jgi:hypothetical protein